jgi:hypothetical protein
VVDARAARTRSRIGGDGTSGLRCPRDTPATVEISVSPSARHIAIAVGVFVSLAQRLRHRPPRRAPGPFTTTLTGAVEVNAQGVPDQGDPDGIGVAVLRITAFLGEVCWRSP